MYYVMLTVLCYTISSLGDKYISSKLKCTPPEFAFIVSSATMVWIGLLIPLTGWGFVFTIYNVFLLLSLVVWKIMEFYTSALLLKTISAYELKAWLGINIAWSYYYNIIQGIYQWNIWVVFFTLMLLAGIIMIVQGQTVQKEDFAISKKRLCILFLLFIASKFLYGLTIGKMTECKTTSVLFLVMFLTALMQLKRVKIKEIVRRRGMTGAFLTRIPNAAGLILEAFAAMESLFLYAMIQPVQLALLFIVSLVKKEPMGKKKLAGSLLCIFSVCAITILISG